MVPLEGGNGGLYNAIEAVRDELPSVYVGQLADDVPPNVLADLAPRYERAYCLGSI